MEFTHTVTTLWAGPQDMLVSFKVNSLFINVTTGDALRLLSRRFDEGTLRLFCHILTSSFFSFNGQLYKQTDGVAMGLLLSPVITKFFLEFLIK
jgi:hypothetical protein